MKIANATFLTIPNAIENFISFFLSITLKYENDTKTKMCISLRHSPPPHFYLTKKNDSKLTITYL